MQLISVEHLTVGYGDKIVLKNASITVCSQDFIGIIGPNGGGKTTFIRALLGRLKPIQGRVNYLCDNLKIGYLPQTTTIDRQFPISVLDVVCSGSRNQKNIHQRAMRWLTEAGMEHHAKDAISELSGGELQRILLCRALVDDPQLLVLDEPTTYVDNKFEKTFYDILHQLNQTIAIIMVSHDLGTITQHVKTIACINRSFHYHPSNIITAQQLASYDCPLQIVRHGDVPHTVLLSHE